MIPGHIFREYDIRGEADRDLSNELAHAIGPSSPYHRHDLIVIAFAVILLITYWWANQGAFSALIHLLCVITAGAVAFALWEPLAYRMLSSSAGEYAKGLVLLGVFILLLLVLRLATDRYLDASLDLRVARATWRWIREALSTAALRHGRPGDRHLVALSPRLLETVALEVPESPVTSGSPSSLLKIDALRGNSKRIGLSKSK